VVRYFDLSKCFHLNKLKKTVNPSFWLRSRIQGISCKKSNKSSGATALQDLGRQSGRCRSAKLVPTFADRGVSCGQRNGSPRPLISVYRTWIATYFIQVALNGPHKAHESECTPFQTPCHPENLIAPGIEPETSVSVARNPDR